MSPIYIKIKVKWLNLFLKQVIKDRTLMKCFNLKKNQ